MTLKNGTDWPLNTAYNGDCLEFMNQLPDKCIDLVLTDPPYGIKRSGQNKSAPNKQNSRHGGKKYFEDKEWDCKIPHADVFNEIFRISKNQIIWGGNYFVQYLVPKMGWIVWDKMQDGFNSEAELCYTSFDSALKIFRQNRGILAKENTIHPTQKPLKLFKWCLEKYSKPGNLIFDPFLGSFTTAVACHSHGLNWLGCEKDEDYFKAGKERYETECLQNLMDFG